MTLEDNLQKYVDILRTVKRDGIEHLIEFLYSSDFAIAPASCNYHQNYEGGLCEHSLNVYNNLVGLNEKFNLGFDEESIILVSLLHDLSKVNFYEKYDKNIKVNGQWVQQKAYKVKGQKDRFVFGTHEQNSVFIANQFIDLKIEEQVAINAHHGGIDNNHGTPLSVINDIYANYKLPLYLHIADLMDAFNE